jgi:hypothetical protein
MDEEFVKILKECDAHSNEYVERLKDETRVTAIIDSLQNYIERQSLPAELCRLYMRKIEHMYYKFDPNTIKLHNVRSAYRSINFFFINFIEFSCRMRRKSRKIPPWLLWTAYVATSMLTIRKRESDRGQCCVIFTIMLFMTNGTRRVTWCLCHISRYFNFVFLTSF